MTQWSNTPNVVSDRIVPAKSLWNAGLLDLVGDVIEVRSRLTSSTTIQGSPGPDAGSGDPAVGSSGLFGPILVQHPVAAASLRAATRGVERAPAHARLVPDVRRLLRPADDRPGDPPGGPQRDAGADRARSGRSSGLDKPVYEQFWIYAEGVVTDFDLGYSYYSEVPVREEIFSRLPASIAVALGAFILWMAIALPVGILTALRPRSKTDRVVTGTTLVLSLRAHLLARPRHAVLVRERHRPLQADRRGGNVRAAQ